MSFSSSSSSPYAAATLYSKSILSKDIELKFTELNSIDLENFDHSLEQYIVKKIQALVEEKCIEEGYVKKNSVRMLSLSCGLQQADKIKYTASYECQICLPVEGMRITCEVKSVSTGGIRAVIHGEEVSPMLVFVSRDLWNESTDRDLSDYEEKDVFDAEVYGVKYELNDTFVQVLAKIV